MSARFAGNCCFRCGEPVYVGRYSPSGSSLCAECIEDEREQIEDDARQQLADAEELRDGQ